MSKNIPITATHWCEESAEWLRHGKNGYAEVYLNNRFWCECPTLKNYELPFDGYMPVSYKYQYIVNMKSTLAIILCNIRLKLIKSKCRAN